MDSAQEVSDFSSHDGRLTVEGFSVASRDFADKWRRHNQSLPPWSWIPLINRTLLVSNKEVSEEESLDEATGSLGKEESIDQTILVQNLENEAHYYDFHIVYSASYGVRVLYFRGYCSGGEPLSLDVSLKKMCPQALLVYCWNLSGHL